MDRENTTKAAHAAELLRADLLALTHSQNPILAEYARSILARFSPIEVDLTMLAEVVQ